MNTLSWLIYFSEVSQGMKVLFGTFAGVSALVGGGTSLVLIMLAGDGDYESKKAINAFFLSSALVAFLASVSILIPSSKTILMIAASEAGEAIVSSPDAKEVLGDITRIIKQRLKDEVAE